MKPWIVPAAALLLTACASQSMHMDTAARQDSIYKRFTQYMGGCTERFGYDPNKTEALGPHELGPHEREWDECVYEGIKRYLALNSPVPKAYDALIAEHKKLTDEVAAGKITRAERRKQSKALFDSIRSDEAALMEKEDARSKAKADMETQREIERVRRDVDRARRSLLNSM